MDRAAAAILNEEEEEHFRFFTQDAPSNQFAVKPARPWELGLELPGPEKGGRRKKKGER